MTNWQELRDEAGKAEEASSGSRHRPATGAFLGNPQGLSHLALLNRPPYWSGRCLGNPGIPNVIVTLVPPGPDRICTWSATCRTTHRP